MSSHYVRCLIGQVPTMSHGKGGRHNQFLDKWLKEFGWLQTRDSGDDLLMICKDHTKTGKKNAFMSGYKNFQRCALVQFGISQYIRTSLTSRISRFNQLERLFWLKCWVSQQTKRFKMADKEGRECFRMP